MTSAPLDAGVLCQESKGSLLQSHPTGVSGGLRSKNASQYQQADGATFRHGGEAVGQASMAGGLRTEYQRQTRPSPSRMRIPSSDVLLRNRYSTAGTQVAHGTTHKRALPRGCPYVFKSCAARRAHSNSTRGSLSSGGLAASAMYACWNFACFCAIRGWAGRTSVLRRHRLRTRTDL